MTRGRRPDRPASSRAETLGWLAFLLFVAGVYRLRQALNRSAREY
jgi:hypothetical protein